MQGTASKARGPETGQHHGCGAASRGTQQQKYLQFCKPLQQNCQKWGFIFPHLALAEQTVYFKMLLWQLCDLNALPNMERVGSASPAAVAEEGECPGAAALPSTGGALAQTHPFRQFWPRCQQA